MKTLLPILFATLALSASTFGQSMGGTVAHLETKCPSTQVIAGDSYVVSVRSIPPWNKQEAAAAKYLWTVSDGTIESGQGTPKITVRTSTSTTFVTTSVEVGGLSYKPGLTSCSVDVVPRPEARLTDEFPYTNFEYLQKKMDDLMIELTSDPTARGYVFMYAESGVQRRRIDAAIKRQMVLRKFDPDRVLVVSGPFRKVAAIQFWFVPAGAKKPGLSLETS